MNTLHDDIENFGPLTFSRERIQAEDALFKQRAALFYTPTDNLPSEVVGINPLNIFIPIPIPSYIECQEIQSYRSPRIWVDLLQRVTGKIRWTPIFPAEVTIVRCDSYQISQTDMAWGAKALIDSLKVFTAGRRDGRLLYYFGAIANDDPKSIRLVFNQENVQHSAQAGTKVIVSPISDVS